MIFQSILTCSYLKKIENLRFHIFQMLLEQVRDDNFLSLADVNTALKPFQRCSNTMPGSSKYRPKH